MVIPGGAAAALAEAAGWGPFFAVETHEPDAVARPPWRPLRELIDDPDVLPDRVARVRAYLAAANERDPADVPVRAAASVAQMGVTARLVSPVLAVAVRTGHVLDLAGAWWRPELGGAFPLSLTVRPVHPEPGDDLHAVADAVARRFLDGPVRELVEAAGGFSLSSHVLWGNVASAVNGSAMMIARARPGLAGPAHDLAALVLAGPRLAGAWERRAGVFRRRSCCLIYQAASAGTPRGVCGDCVLAARTPA